MQVGFHKFDKDARRIFVVAGTMAARRQHVPGSRILAVKIGVQDFKEAIRILHPKKGYTATFTPAASKRMMELGDLDKITKEDVLRVMK